MYLPGSSTSTITVTNTTIPGVSEGQESSPLEPLVVLEIIITNFPGWSSYQTPPPRQVTR
ncbi:hypothetical protein E2C01_060805 [Portunus trituberculatus]|uniref:Uncharacterized protein n=1 Tax=Portunus trituberculatus TaxID=210409 RepID=A0A5B7HAG9_PORTR|nr:hypothetical protein [Portunus trituberculatus]